MLSERLLLHIIYQGLLGRNPDQEGERTYLPMLKKGKSNVVFENILKSGEFRRRFYSLNPLFIYGRPAKQILLNNIPYTICGVAPDDPYFVNLHDEHEKTYLLLIKYFPAKWNAIDVGANIGVKALPLAKHLKEGTVIAIEAAPSVFRCLEINVSINGLSNVKCLNYAIGPKDKEVEFVDNSAWGYIAENLPNGQKPPTVKVPMRTLKNVLKEVGLKRLDFLKVDVEGIDINIIKNAYKEIKKETLVMFEYNPFTIMLNAREDPLSELKWILRKFKFVFVLEKRPVERNILHPIKGKMDEKLHRILEINIGDNGVTDILVTNDPAKAEILEKSVP